MEPPDAVRHPPLPTTVHFALAMLGLAVVGLVATGFAVVTGAIVVTLV